MQSTNPLTQKVNFYISAFFIFTFGFFMTATIVQAMNRSPLFGAVSSPINIELSE